MDADDFYNCESMCERLEARDTLMQINTAAYPTAKREWQKKYHKTIYQKAYPRIESDSLELSTEELARIMSGGG